MSQYVVCVYVVTATYEIIRIYGTRLRTSKEPRGGEQLTFNIRYTTVVPFFLAVETDVLESCDFLPRINRSPTKCKEQTKAYVYMHRFTDALTGSR
jgi:hypothetical protein